MADVGAAIRRLEAEPAPGIDGLIVAEGRLPGEACQLVRRLRSRAAGLPIVVVAATPGVRAAVEAMRAGASDYVGAHEASNEISRALDRLRGLTTRPDAAAGGASAMVWASEAMGAVVRLVDRAATSDLPVLLLGESGTGKELLARRLHAKSARARGPLLPINCAALPATLAESLFLGHRKGSFTGADADRAGYLEAADGGSLLLDEIGDLPASSQGVLLRALEERAVTPVGTVRPVPVSVRVVSATHRDLDEAIARGLFRKDLYYRLNVVAVRVPPLRERLEDLPLLVRAFLREDDRAGCGLREISEGALRVLLSHDWPGNVRELRNVLARSCLLADGHCLRRQHVAPLLRTLGRDPGPELAPHLESLDTLERAQVERALRAAGGNKAVAARLLGIDRKRLYRRIRRWGLES